MFETLLKKAEWGELSDLLAPSFFKVVPAGTLLRTARDLYGSSRDKLAFAAARADRERLLHAAGLPIAIVDVVQSAAPTDAKARGELVLALYFHQLLGEGPWLFDFRFEAFAVDAQQWAPKPWYATFDPAFRRALAQVYRGFYGDDDALFQRGLDALGLRVAEAEFRAQFGAGDQRSVAFTVKGFQESFTAIFRRCRQADVALAPDFLRVGLGLALLYDHLERLGVPLDVRGAFERAA